MLNEHYLMKFGGLSEIEVAKVSEILNLEGIPFSVDRDQEIEEFNSASMKNDLRHFRPPNISTHILAVAIEDQDFQKISESGKLKLLDLGITDIAPSPEDFQSFTGTTLHKELLKEPNRLVVANFKHQIIIGGGLFLALYLMKYIFGF